jgi:hypothetical protein
MSIIKIKDAASIPSEQLEDWGTPKTIGEPICQLRGLFISENEDGSTFLDDVYQTFTFHFFPIQPPPVPNGSGIPYKVLLARLL